MTGGQSPSSTKLVRESVPIVPVVPKNDVVEVAVPNAYVKPKALVVGVDVGFVVVFVRV